jgi:hypothetical protein
MRVGALPIVEHFHVVEDRPNRFLASLKLVSMNELAFQCRKEALDDQQFPRRDMLHVICRLRSSSW